MNYTTTQACGGLLLTNENAQWIKQADKMLVSGDWARWQKTPSVPSLLVLVLTTPFASGPTNYTVGLLLPDDSIAQFKAKLRDLTLLHFGDVPNFSRPINHLPIMALVAAHSSIPLQQLLDSHQLLYALLRVFRDVAPMPALSKMIMMQNLPHFRAAIAADEGAPNVDKTLLPASVRAPHDRKLLAAIQNTVDGVMAGRAFAAQAHEAGRKASRESSRKSAMAQAAGRSGARAGAAFARTGGVGGAHLRIVDKAGGAVQTVGRSGTVTVDLTPHILQQEAGIEAAQVAADTNRGIAWTYDLLPQLVGVGEACAGLDLSKYDEGRLTAHFLCQSVQTIVDGLRLAIKRLSMDQLGMFWRHYAYAPAPVPALWVNATLYSHDINFWHRQQALADALRGQPFHLFEHGCGTGLALAAAKDVGAACRIVGSELDPPSYATSEPLRRCIAALPGITVVAGATAAAANRALLAAMRTCAGMPVVLHGLQKAQHLNGRRGTIVADAGRGRWAVQLEKGKHQTKASKTKAGKGNKGGGGGKSKALLVPEVVCAKHANVRQPGVAVILVSWPDNTGQFKVGDVVQRRMASTGETGVVLARQRAVYIVQFQGSAAPVATPAQGLRLASDRSLLHNPDPFAQFLMDVRDADVVACFESGVRLMIVGDYTPSDLPLSTAGGFTGNCMPYARTILDGLATVPSLCWRHVCEMPSMPCFTHTFDLDTLLAAMGAARVSIKKKMATARRNFTTPDAC